MHRAWTVGQATSISEVYSISYSPRGMPKALGMRTLKYGGGEEGGEEGGKEGGSTAKLVAAAGGL